MNFHDVKSLYMDHRISINTWLYDQRWEKLEILYRVAYDSSFWSHI